MARGALPLEGRSTGKTYWAEGNSMWYVLARFIHDDRGQDLIEYAMLALFIACAVLIGIQQVPNSLDAGYSNIGTQVSAGS